MRVCPGLCGSALNVISDDEHFVPYKLRDSDTDNELLDYLSSLAPKVRYLYYSIQIINNSTISLRSFLCKGMILSFIQWPSP